MTSDRAESFLQEKKDVWNHPRIVDRLGNSHDLAEVLANYAEYEFDLGFQAGYDEAISQMRFKLDDMANE